jgi:hypothetical protein
MDMNGCMNKQSELQFGGQGLSVSGRDGRGERDSQVGEEIRASPDRHQGLVDGGH